jgi:hypothetical protein
VIWRENERANTDRRAPQGTCTTWRGRVPIRVAGEHQATLQLVAQTGEDPPQIDFDLSGLVRSHAGAPGIREVTPPHPGIHGPCQPPNGATSRLASAGPHDPLA